MDDEHDFCFKKKDGTYIDVVQFFDSTWGILVGEKWVQEGLKTREEASAIALELLGFKDLNKPPYNCEDCFCTIICSNCEKWPSMPCSDICDQCC
jgi:hypothetical protein